MATYEDFFPPADVAAYKRVKGGTMRLAEVGREEAADMVGGRLGDGDRSSKQFVRTSRGLYRLSMSSNSDNTTERAAHRRMGATRVVMGDDDQLGLWFVEHGLLSGSVAVKVWRYRVRARLVGS